MRFSDLFSLLLIIQETLSVNTLQNIFEIDTGSTTVKLPDSLIITREINKVIKDYIEIYVSLIEESISNKLKFETTKEYHDSYDKLIGPSTYFFQQKIPGSIRIYNETSGEIKSLRTQDDILLEEIYFARDTNYKIIIMRNIFYYHFDNCSRKYDWFDFYDLNIAKGNFSHCDYDTDSFRFVSTSTNISDFVKENNFEVVLNSPKVKIKLEKYREVFNLLNLYLFSREDTKVNLLNYLTMVEISKLTNRLKEISNLILVINSYMQDDRIFTVKFAQLKNKLKSFALLLDKYQLTKDKLSLNFVYYLFMTIIILSVLYQITKMIREINEAYKRKTN